MSSPSDSRIPDQLSQIDSRKAHKFRSGSNKDLETLMWLYDVRTVAETPGGRFYFWKIKHNKSNNYFKTKLLIYLYLGETLALITYETSLIKK